MKRMTADVARNALAQNETGNKQLAEAILDRMDVLIQETSKTRTFIQDVLNRVTEEVPVGSPSDLIQSESIKCSPEVTKLIQDDLIARGFKIEHQMTSRSHPPFNAKFDISWA